MAINDLDDLYRNPILEHSRNPRNSCRVNKPDTKGNAVNPFCGDEVSLQIKMSNGQVSRIGVQSYGCSINKASASILSEAINGKTCSEIETIMSQFNLMMRDPHIPDTNALHSLSDIEALMGVRQFPIRIKCALLAWSALSDAMQQHSYGH